MSRELVANTNQFSQVARLVDRLGVSAYRDAKRQAGLDWNVPFGRLYRLEAGTVIGILREKLNETKGKDCEQKS
jgi:hypothetical protein